MRRGLSVVIGVAMISLVAAASAAACSSFEAEQPDGDGGGGSESGGGTDGTTTGEAGDAGGDRVDGDLARPRCATFSPFVKVGPLPGTVNTTAPELGPRVINDGLTLVFHRTAISTTSTLYVATRESLDKPFGAVTPMDIEFSNLDSAHASFSADELTMYFDTRQSGQADIYRQTRATKLAAFSSRTIVPVSTNVTLEVEPWIVGSELFFTHQVGAGFSIYVALSNGAGGFSAKKRVAGVNDELEAGVNNTHAVLTPDGLAIYFAREIGANYDMWVARRPSIGAAFADATKLTGPDINSNATDVPGWISADECTLYFATKREAAGDYQIYVAERFPPPP